MEPVLRLHVAVAGQVNSPEFIQVVLSPPGMVPERAFRSLQPNDATGRLQLALSIGAKAQAIITSLAVSLATSKTVTELQPHV